MGAKAIYVFIMVLLEGKVKRHSTSGIDLDLDNFRNVKGHAHIP